MRTIGRLSPPDRIIAVSTDTANQLKKQFARLSGSIVVVPNGIELPLFEQRDVKDRLRTVFTAARLTHQKNVQLLICAMGRVLDVVRDASLTILGDGELRADLEAQARRLGIFESVHFTGYCLTPETYYADLDVFVLPSRWEPFGLALVEAMAWGKPCISTDVGGVSEYLLDGTNGLLVPSDNPESLALAILSLLDNPKMAHNLGKQARLTAGAMGIDKSVAKIQSIYREVLSGF